jgi:TolB protein
MRTALALAVAASLIATSGADAAFPGKNGRIAFESDRDGDGELFLTKINGRGTRKLTDNEIDDSDPRFSPNGRQIVFERTYADGTDAEIARLNVKTGRARRLTDNEFEEGDPQFSPDGKRVVFISDRDGDQEIFTFKARNGRALDRVTENASDDWDPSWAPNGRRIAYTHSDPMDEGFDLEIATIRPDGTGFRKLTDNQEMIGDNEPEWSPNSKRIVFESDRPLDPMGMMDDEVWIMRRSGNGQRRLTTNATTFEGDAAFAPNGKWITFESNMDGDGEVFRMKPDGSRVRRVTDNPANDAEPDWQPKPRRRRR